VAGRSSDRARALIAALQPGAWPLAEELDFASAVTDPHMRLAGDLADAGLTELG
jgi:hypothetical protein